jgi:hypothetical protein
MTRIGFFCVLIPLITAFILDKFFLIDILRRSNGQKPEFAEFFHMILTGIMGKTHKELLIDAGLKPTTRDNCLHYLIVAMGWLILVGIVVLIIGILVES